MELLGNGGMKAGERALVWNVRSGGGFYTLCLEVNVLLDLGPLSARTCSLSTRVSRVAPVICLCVR
jgi:hypothetical protein